MDFIAFSSNDSRRGAWWQVPYKSKKKFKLKVPRSFSDKLIRTLGEGVINIGVNEKQIVVKTNEYTLYHPSTNVRTSKNDVIKFISDMEKSKDPSTVFTADIGELLTSVSEVTSILQGDDSDVTITFGEDFLKMTTKSRYGSARTKVPVSYVGKKKVDKVMLAGYYFSEFLGLSYPPQLDDDKEEGNNKVTIHAFRNLVLVVTSSFRGVLSTIIQ